VFDTESVQDVLRHAEDGIDGLDGGLAQEGEAGHAEQRVEGIRHVPGAVRKPARLRVLQQRLLVPFSAIKTLNHLHYFHPKKYSSY
jgi:hypothetical protein